MKPYRSLGAATTVAAVAAMTLAAVTASADPVMDDELVINEELELMTDTPAPEHLGGVLGETIYSG